MVQCLHEAPRPLSSLVECCSVPQLKSKRDPFVEEFFKPLWSGMALDDFLRTL
jgi:hypothetical protein